MRRLGPFEEHIREALAVNRLRAAAYARLTGSASNRVFRRFVLMQRLVLPFARWFDARARTYEDAGIPLLSSVFESMRNIPEVATAKGEARVDDGWRADGARIAARLLRAFRDSGFAGAAAVADEALRELAARPWRDSMLRHQLESILRLCNVSTGNIERAVAAGLPSPERLLRQVFRYHLLGVRFAALLDAPALPLQLAGFSILADDVPAIAPWPDQNRQPSRFQ